jgi:hypothetical protein
MYRYYFLLLVLFINSALADNSISLLHGNGFKTDASERTIMRFDGTKITKDYMIYYRADVNSVDDAHALLNTRLIGHLGTGLHVSAQIQNAKSVSLKGVGVGYSKFDKNFSYFTDLNYTNTSYNTDALQSFTYVKAYIADDVFMDGYVDMMFYPDKTNTILTQPAINYQLGGVVLGLEQHIYINKGMVKDLNENLTLLKIKYTY